MIVLGIDPNPQTSGWAVWDSCSKTIIGHGTQTNDMMLTQVKNGRPFYNRIAIERVRSYGQVLGNETIDTVEWYGGFVHVSTVPVSLIPRPQILREWGVANKSSDKYLKEYLVDHYPALFPAAKRGKTGALTVKGWESHDMSALAVAIYVGEQL